MKVGDYDVFTVLAGYFRLDGGAMFGVVPKMLWEKALPGDLRNRILLAMRVLVIRGKNRVICVDCGAGEHWPDNLNDIYAFDYSQFRLVHELAKHGIRRDDVTDLVLTHLHFDHVGGATTEGPYGENKTDGLVFPNADVWIGKENWDHACCPTEKDRASFFRALIEPLALKDRLHLVAQDSEIAPHVVSLLTEGHTPGQQLVQVQGGDHTLLFCGDTIPTSHHVPLPYIMAYDLAPLKTLEEKKRLLEQAASENWGLVFSHDPHISACTVQLAKGKYQRGESLSL